jgi:RNA-directed DNA polymerase
MKENYPCIDFERYADDIIIHFRSKKQLEMLKNKIYSRFIKCKLTLNKEKCKVVYCKDTNRNNSYECTSFTFLGYTFRPRVVRAKDKCFFVSFTPAISPGAAKRIRQTIKKTWKLKKRIDLSLSEMAKAFNPAIQGWINYYGKFHGSALYSSVIDYLNTTLMR